MESKSLAIFIDASVLFAASDSERGASREIIRYALRGQIQLVINKFVLEETRKNLASKRPDALYFFQILEETIPFEIVNPTLSEVLAMQPYTAFKDAPHFASALKGKVFCLVSLDRKHMIGIRDRIVADLGLRILLPSELLQELRGLR